MQNKYLKVKDSEELVRDTNSSAILNTDIAGLKAYKAKKAKEALIEQISKENTEIKAEMAEIKDLLRQLIAGKK